MRRGTDVVLTCGNAPEVVEPPEGVARQEHPHAWRFLDAAMVAAALGLAAICLILDLNGALRLLGLPPDAVSTPWIRDEFTTGETDAAQGRLIAELAIAPVRPYEFVVVRLGVSRGELMVSEV